MITGAPATIAGAQGIILWSHSMILWLHSIIAGTHAIIPGRHLALNELIQAEKKPFSRFELLQLLNDRARLTFAAGFFGGP